MSSRHELETAIEREVHKLMFKVSDHVYDFVNLYVRRNNVPVEYEQMETILKLVRVAIQDGQLKQIDFFHEGIKKVVDETYGSNDTPFIRPQSTNEMKTESKKDETITFSLT